MLYEVITHEPNPTAQGAGNPFRFYSYLFIPKDLDRSRQQRIAEILQKYPLN